MKRDAFNPRGDGFDGAFKAAFGGIYAGRRVLVTGHTGFKGSWLALWLRALGAQVSGLALPAVGAPNHCRLLALPMEEALIDLRDAGAVKLALQRLAPEIIIHLAAQPLVRHSYREPLATWASNVMGLVNLYEAVRVTPSVRALVNVTSDKCYSQGPSHRPFTESDALGGHDPYSASKACAELVSASYRASFFSHDDGRGHCVGLATARAGNVIGGGDWGEDRLVPDLVRSVAAGQSISIRNPQATRPWQHVLDPLAGYLMLGQRLWQQPELDGQAWNFGPDGIGHIHVGELVARLAALWPQIRCEFGPEPGSEAPPHEAPWLALDCSKAKAQLGWRPVWDIHAALERTAQWYRRLHQHAQVGSHDDLLQYWQDACAMGLAWTGSAAPAASVAQPGSRAWLDSLASAATRAA